MKINEPLPDKLKQIFKEYLREKDYRQTSKLTGVSVPTIKKLLYEDYNLSLKNFEAVRMLSLLVYKRARDINKDVVFIKNYFKEPAE